MGAVRRHIEEFVSRHPRLSDPMGADNQCRIASDDLVDFLCSKGVRAVPTWLREHRDPPANPSPRASRADRHRVVRLPDGSFVDVTRRQFDPWADHPTYYDSEAELVKHWRQIDRGPVDASVEAELWEDLEGPDTGR
jgi:hypothetical protein